MKKSYVLSAMCLLSIMSSANAQYRRSSPSQPAPTYVYPSTPQYVQPGTVVIQSGTVISSSESELIDPRLGDAKFSLDTFKFDGKVMARKSAWMKGYNNSFYNGQTEKGNVYQAYKSVKCGHISNYLEIINFDCYVSITEINLKERELIVFVDMMEGGLILSRYMGGIKGTTVDYAGEINKKTITKNKKIDNLGQALTALGAYGLKYGQDNYKTGKLSLVGKTELVANPLRDASVAAKFDNFYPAYNKKTAKDWQITKSSTLSIELDSNFQPEVQFESIDKLFTSVNKTTKLLSDAYKKYVLGGYNPKAENKDEELDQTKLGIFKDVIIENKALIAEELRNARIMMTEKKFHILEIMHFTNRLADLVDSVDAILKGDKGTEPDFLNILNFDK